MAGFFGAAVWVVSFALEVYILFRCISTRTFSRYLTINLFVAVMAVRDSVVYLVMSHYGVSSVQYAAAYYFTDGLLTVLMYLAIMHLYEQVFEQMPVGKYIRGATVLLLSATALFSFVAVRGTVGHVTYGYFTELSQDLYFVGLVLTYLLWAAVFKLRETRARLVQLVLALGVYFSGTAAVFALMNMFPRVRDAISDFSVVPLLGMLLLASWAYTFTRVPEGARLAPAHLVREATAER